MLYPPGDRRHRHPAPGGAAYDLRVDSDSRIEPRWRVDYRPLAWTRYNLRSRAGRSYDSWCD